MRSQWLPFDRFRQLILQSSTIANGLGGIGKPIAQPELVPLLAEPFAMRETEVELKPRGLGSQARCRQAASSSAAAGFLNLKQSPTFVGEHETE
ncbi:MAG TPA: hypothetical protein VKU02_00455 [Gemmataceae bacterium]|nr:hypothetical protein [Gemmataceae bacterium]